MLEGGGRGRLWGGGEGEVLVFWGREERGESGGGRSIVCWRGGILQEGIGFLFDNTPILSLFLKEIY